MGYNVNRIKERAAEFEEQYDEAYIEALLEDIESEFGEDSYEYKTAAEAFDGLDAESIDSTLIEEIAAGFADDAGDDFIEIFSNFKFEDVSDWCYSMVDSELCDIGDQQRDLERDRAWEEQND